MAPATITAVGMALVERGEASIEARRGEEALVVADEEIAPVGEELQDAAPCRRSPVRTRRRALARRRAATARIDDRPVAGAAAEIAGDRSR